MGHNDRERRRLALQGTILNPFTEHLLRRAGISSGMHVLDVGCGIGDVSLLAANLVGRHGSVTSIDLDTDTLQVARQRARESSVSNIKFVQSAIADYHPERSFHAVIGRHILIHLPEPLAALRQAHGFLYAGGVAVFHEFDFSIVHPSYPPCPLRTKLVESIRRFFCRDGQAGTGSRLFHMLIEAGYATPDCRAEYPMDGGPDSHFYEWFAESFRSLYPVLKSRGFADGMEDLDLDTLAEKVREEAVSQNASIPGPVMVAAFARKPAS